jgi:hypothetical protein
MNSALNAAWSPISMTLLGMDDIDIIDICTPPGVHYAMMIFEALKPRASM